MARAAGSGRLRNVQKSQSNQSHTPDRSRRCYLVAGGIGAVARDIADIGRTGVAAGETAAGVVQLTGDSERLTMQISAFLGRLRAA